MNEEHIFIVRCGEVALKGMNKPYFERMLAERIRKLLKKFDGVSVYRHEGLIFVRADKSLDKQAVIREISKVFGVASISPAVECESNMEAIGAAAVEYMLEAIRERGVKTFKVEAKRADKNFPVKSPEKNPRYSVSFARTRGSPPIWLTLILLGAFSKTLTALSKSGAEPVPMLRKK